jgi:5-methyltetrahydrofolate--homocysteine methyltransferase
MSVIDNIKECIIDGNKKAIVGLVEQALQEDISPASILNDGMIAAMAVVGARFESGEFFVPEMLVAARAMQAGLNRLKPELIRSGAAPTLTVAIGTVFGDLHDIGKNLVSIMLEGAGYAVKDLGVNVPPEAFVQAAQEGAQVIAMSALLTTTMPAMKTVIDALTAAGLRERVKVIVGGAPLTDAYARQIGADGYSPDASQAANLIRSLIAA